MAQSNRVDKSKIDSTSSKPLAVVHLHTVVEKGVLEKRENDGINSFDICLMC
jgi:hypothetical protein